jgi:hypothetical protein
MFPNKGNNRLEYPPKYKHYNPVLWNQPLQMEYTISAYLVFRWPFGGFARMPHTRPRTRTI